MSRFISEIKVDEEDLDIFNHVNNLVFIKYLERARFDWYNKHDFQIETLINKGLGFVLRNIEVSFIGEGRLGDVLTIETSPYKRGNTSFTMKQNISNQSGILITEAQTTSVMIDMNRRRPIPLIEEIGKHFG
ncbi:acyl-CoA thioesterase [Oceanobacillus longus]|uniref:Acyl-CoA thioesterase n=1 Tax=Oceanobacillus longus TaxID=930120 RepID=A0ABV8H103_9BACI